MIPLISSYVKHAAIQSMQSLVWENTESQLIPSQVLLLANKLAPAIDHQTLVDLAVVYAPTHTTLVRAVFLAALDSTASTFAVEIATAFTKLLATARNVGLYGLRKIAHCINCVLHVSPPQVIRHFFCNRDFMVALAFAYDDTLTSMARTYGGLHIDSALQRKLDEWEHIWLETKVALMDSFHVLADGITQSFGNDLSALDTHTTDQILDNLLHILDGFKTKSDTTTTTTTPVPFLNRPLLADYEHAYHFSGKLSSPATSRDPRLDRLRSSLSLFSNDILPSDSNRNQNPGALSLLLQAAGFRLPLVPPAATQIPKGKGKAIEPPAVALIDPELDLKVAQVREILPDYPQEYIRTLLTHQAYQYHGNTEEVVQALLEGTAPTITEVKQEMSQKLRVVNSNVAPGDEFVYTAERRNVFDDEDMDLSLVRVGKKRQDENTFLRDRADIEAIKADIFRRMEELSDDDDDDEEGIGLSSIQNRDKGKKVVSPTPDEDDGVASGVVSRLKVFGDGEDDSGDGVDGESDEERDAISQLPETILELAYIRDPKLFDRDAQTRRSKPRADLKAQTGWADEQIEGWRIMLERNPKKDRILQKHEFTGNKPLPAARDDDEGQSSNQNTGMGRGRGRGGRGGGRGGGASTGGDTRNAKNRVSKDRNKASRGNHNRKRGHDKKMARAGGPS